MSPPDAIQVDVIVGLDARGFLLGPAMALAINKPFVPIRSPVKKLSKAPKSQQQKLKSGVTIIVIKSLS